MSKTKNEAVGQIQAKAKKAAGTVGTAVKDNAVVAVFSGKVLANGLKEIGAGYVADSREAVATLADDFAALAKVTSAPELVRLQREQATRNFAALSAAATRNAEQLGDLVGRRVAPLVKGRLKANLDLFRKKP